MDKKTIDNFLLFLLVLIILVLSFFVLKPLLTILFISFILAYSFSPLYNFLYKKIKSKAFSAFIIVFIFVLIIFLPLVLLTPTLIAEVRNLYLFTQNIELSETIRTISPYKFSEDTLKKIDTQFSLLNKDFFNFLTNFFSSFIYTNFPTILFGFIIFLFLFYYIIQNLDELSKEIFSLIPLKEEALEKFVLEFKNITKTVVYGQVLLGILQGLLIGLFLYVINFESIVFFTFVGIIAGILPIIGMSVVWIPVSLILLIQNKIVVAILLVIYANIVSLFIDGFLRPYIISERTLLSIPLSFVGVVGGIYAFGMLGILIGPLVLSYLILIINFYKEGKFKELLK
ncbi:MAG: AI-2E family transporter [Candidatus Pacearchaeota archaeon]